jgi:hypothetical protein
MLRQSFVEIQILTGRAGTWTVALVVKQRTRMMMAVLLPPIAKFQNTGPQIRNSMCSGNVHAESV